MTECLCYYIYGYLPEILLPVDKSRLSHVALGFSVATKWQQKLATKFCCQKSGEKRSQKL